MSKPSSKSIGGLIGEAVAASFRQGFGLKKQVSVHEYQTNDG